MEILLLHQKLSIFSKQDHYWYVPVRWLMLDQFRSLETILAVKAPILILHGTEDRIIPFAFGRQLFDAASEPKRFVRIEGGNHARNLEQGRMAAVEEFLAAIESRSPDRASTGAVTPARAP
ncbi:hypothetical protein BB934_16770 [Microvirga ossetica]|uniref:Serine aminopeptidase S33 domain-containing protein n=2 Tax=Microvirga ossetica TaxID=1882682 RepID=A0A1B2EI82_9HYPH|nr:hypothetical protein BB934_16770 [Microvirga ossetica]